MAEASVQGDDRLRRSASDRVVAGVCGGIGEALGVDAVLVRLAFVLAAPLGGIGFALYVIAAVLMPGPPPAGAPAPTPGRGGRGPRGPVIGAWFIRVTH